MPEPTTLRALADLPQSPAALADSALIMIDCQNTYTRGVMELDRVQAALDEAAALHGEPVVVKSYPNAFVRTELDARPKAVDASNLVLAGFMTHMCVNSTARGAFNLGYAPTVVAAATATRTLPGLDGAPLPASTLHSASLVAMADLFAVVVPDAAGIAD